MNSLYGRVFVGKMCGLVLGLGFMFMMPIFGMEVGGMYSWGVLLLMVMMGALIGMIGVFDTHPVFGFSMAWYVRGPAIGALFMLILVLINYDAVYAMMLSPMVSWMGFTSPFWIVLDGVVIGGIIGFLCTRIAGEGSRLTLN